MSTKTQREGLALLEIFTAAAVFVLVTVLVIILLQIGFYAMRDRELVRKNIAPAEFADLRAEQVARLAEPVRWVNEEAGRVGMPIDKATASVVRTNGGGTTAP